MRRTKMLFLGESDVEGRRPWIWCLKIFGKTFKYIFEQRQFNKFPHTWLSFFAMFAKMAFL